VSGRKLRVLVVDDSPVVRKVVSDILRRVPRIAMVDTAPNGRLALKKVEKLDPHVVTMDVEMPGMGGLAALRRIMARSPRPVIMLSAYTFDGAAKTMRALELGAVDFIQKPGGRLSRDVNAVADELVAKVLAVAGSLPRQLRAVEERGSESADSTQVVPVRKPARPLQPGAPEVVAIGASTGGTEAIRKVLEPLPSDFPVGIVVVQHMPAGFTKAFAERLNELCAVKVKEASHRDMVLPGRALIAPGHSHMLVRSGSYGLHVDLNRHPEVSGHRPSVDVLFSSVAEACGARSVAALLTGMGRDGALGMARIHEAGGYTLAQDEASCVVFGMPRAAVSEGGVEEAADIRKIPTLIQRSLSRQKGTRGRNAGSELDDGRATASGEE
jgi:two-component system chemotaxis response regulator CheB